jgi:hypothetical protein
MQISCTDLYPFWTINGVGVDKNYMKEDWFDRAQMVKKWNAYSSDGEAWKKKTARKT